MRKLLLLICALLTGISGAWADDIVVTINDQSDLSGITNTSTSEATATHKYGVYSGSDQADTPYYTTFTSNVTSGLEGVTVSTEAKILKPTYVPSSYTNYQHVMAIHYDKDDNNTVHTFTISAPTGYYIKSYSFFAISTSDGGSYKITPCGGNTQIAKGASEPQTISATVNASTATFTVQRNTKGNASTLCIPRFSVTLARIPVYDESYTTLNINGSSGELGHNCGNTSTSWYCLWTSTSSPEGLTLTSGTRNNMQLEDSKINIHSNNSPTYTITAPSGYMIAGYNIGIYAGASGSNITPSGCNSTAISTDPSNPTFVYVTGVNAKTATFTRSGTSANGYATTFVVYLKKTVSITYKVQTGSGAEIYSRPTETWPGTIITSLPAQHRRDYCTYNDVNVTADADKTVTFTATWNFPFEISSTYENAHWYDMSIRSTWYVTSDQTDNDGALSTVNANALGLATDAYQWAFIGNPYNLKLYNKSKGEEFVYAWENTSNESIPTFVSAATGNSWTIKASTAPGYTNAFMLTIPDYGYQVNQFGGEGGSLKIWNNTTTADAGSAFKVFDVPTDFSEYVISEIAPYMENEATYFNWTSAARTEIGYDASYKTNCPYATYASMKTALTSALEDLNNNVNFPTEGYYRIKNRLTTDNYGYMGLNGGTSLLGNISNTSDASSIIHLTKDGNKYYFQTQGKYTSNIRQDEAVSLVDTPPTEAFAMQAQAIGYVAFRTWDDGPYSYYHASKDKGYKIVGWENSANASQWSIEDVTSIDVTLRDGGDGYYYTTAYFDFPVSYNGASNGEGLFVLTGESNGKATAQKVTSVPAKQGFLIRIAAENVTDSKVTLTIPASADALTGTNILTGTCLATTKPDGNVYVFSKVEDDLGFFPYTGTDIPANRAYIVESDGNVRSFILSFEDTTGINGVSTSMPAGTIFDMQGRRVNKAEKGLYIVNGKKVLF